jgi:predicted outer membrane repeat protein
MMDSRLMISETTFAENKASYTGSSTAAVERSDLKIEGSKFIGNSADIGAALFISDFSTTEIKDTAFSGNRAETIGGAITALTSNVVLDNTEFSNNWSLKATTIYLKDMQTLNEMEG